MAQKAILEYDCKRLLAEAWPDFFPPGLKFNYQGYLWQAGEVLFADTLKTEKWLLKSPLVVKPDMLFGNRGLNGLVFMPTGKIGEEQTAAAREFIESKSSGPVTLKDGRRGMLRRFLVEPKYEYDPGSEWYIAFSSGEDSDSFYFSCRGGINIEERWESTLHIELPVTSAETDIEILLYDRLLPFLVKEEADTQKEIPGPLVKQLVGFAAGLYRFFKNYHFSYLEINPFVVVPDSGEVLLLDAVAKLDDTAAFLMHKKWQGVRFPAPFGRPALTGAETTVKKLDAGSGSSLKLTLLNPKARVWQLVAGGGASVVYTDTILNYWPKEDLGNYGEYSGNPSENELFQYTSALFELMLQEPAPPEGKILLIGGAIANFTDVATTFRGIIRAMDAYADRLKKLPLYVYVRRGGPNYELGLKLIRRAAKLMGLKIEIYGPATHLTEIVRSAKDDESTRIPAV